MSQDDANGTKAILVLEKEIEELTALINFQNMELIRISTAIGEKVAKLRYLKQLLLSVNIDLYDNDIVCECVKLIQAYDVADNIEIDPAETDTAFFLRLKKRCSNIDQRETAILNLIRLNYTTREIADIFGVTKNWLDSIRYKLHKKLGLQPHQSIKTFLQSEL